MKRPLREGPWWLKVPIALLFLNTIVGGIVWEGVSRGWWSSPAPTPGRTYEIVWRGGRHTYVSPEIGQAFDAAIPVQFSLLGVAFFAAWWSERKGKENS